MEEDKDEMKLPADLIDEYMSSLSDCELTYPLKDNKKPQVPKASTTTTDEHLNVHFRKYVVRPIVQAFKNRAGNKEMIKQYNEVLRNTAQAHSISVKTLRRWIAKEEQGESLEPLPIGRKTQELNEAYKVAVDMGISLRSCYSERHITIEQIIEHVEEIYPQYKHMIKRSTLQRKLQQRGYARANVSLQLSLGEHRSFGRYEPNASMYEIQGDMKEERNLVVDENGNYITVFIQVYIDHHSRRVLSYGVGTSANSELALVPLYELVRDFGKPICVHVDNGAAYRSNLFKGILNKLGIKLKYSRVYHPQSKGCIERFNNTLNTKIIDLLRCAFDAKVTNKRLTLEDFKRYIGIVIDKYNFNTIHSAIKAIPHVKFMASFNKDEVLQSYLEQLFVIEGTRKINLDGTVSYKNVFFKVNFDADKSLRPYQEIKVYYDFINDILYQGPIKDGIMMEPLVIGPHVVKQKSTELMLRDQQKCAEKIKNYIIRYRTRVDKPALGNEEMTTTIFALIDGTINYKDFEISDSEYRHALVNLKKDYISPFSSLVNENNNNNDNKEV